MTVSTARRAVFNGSRSSVDGRRSILGHAVGQHLDGTPFPTQQRAKHLLLERRVKAADQYSARLDPRRDAGGSFELDAARAEDEGFNARRPGLCTQHGKDN